MSESIIVALIAGLCATIPSMYAIHKQIQDYFTRITNSTNMFTNVPANCLIIVADTTQKDWFATKFPNLTNVKTVAEL